MHRPVQAIEVRIWGQPVGAVALDPKLGYYAFEYDPHFVAFGIDLAPLAMPLAEMITQGYFCRVSACDSSIVRTKVVVASISSQSSLLSLCSAWNRQKISVARIAIGLFR